MASIAIRMPKMSMTMTEGEVSEWFVKPGDTVAEGDVVCEVLTDKVDMEVESPADGVLSKIAVESGSVEVGTPIGWLEAEEDTGFGDLLAAPDPGEEPDTDAGPSPTDEPAAAASPIVEPSPTPAPNQADKPAQGPIPAVPRARSLAASHGVDLGTVRGSGPDGLVTMSDVEALVAAGPAQPTPGRSVPARKESKRAATIRGRVAAKMTESATVPQFTVWRDLYLDEVDAERGAVSWTTLLLQAYADALAELPQLLRRWDGSAPVETGPPAVALAVDTAEGLLAPVLVSPHQLPTDRLDRVLREVVAAAQEGRVEPAYLQVANATLSNLGGLGVDRFAAIVTPPQASVLSVGAVSRRAVAVPGGVGTALTVTVGLTVDHRVADGADGARLLGLLDDALRKARR